MEERKRGIIARAKTLGSGRGQDAEQKLMAQTLVGMEGTGSDARELENVVVRSEEIVFWLLLCSQ